MFSLPHLVRLTTIYSCKRMIVDLHFHPTYSLSSDLPSKYSGWLAVASSEPTIHIIDCTAVFEGGPQVYFFRSFLVVDVQMSKKESRA